jgi:hypothetical protein
MQDDTREHKRPQEVVVPGRRVTLAPEKTFLLPLTNSRRLVIHFHGPAWLAESAARRAFPGVAVLSVQANGSSSDAYRTLLAPAAERFPEMVKQAEAAAGVTFTSIVLSSFSAGYGAIREILRDKESWNLVDGVVLADSMHAEYGGEARDLDAFLDFAREAAGGRKRFVIVHSEVFPGTYASTTEAASYLLRELQLKREPVLEWGTLGMQQLSKVVKGGLQVLGFAGNSAPDHMDHFFALEDWYRRLGAFPAKRSVKR